MTLQFINLRQEANLSSSMKRRRIGRSGLVVTEICLGTMTFGEQANEPMAHRILNRAFDAGIDFYDLAEMYPVPPSAGKFGLTEEIFGRWMRGQARDSLIVATKITGPGHGWFRPPVRHGMTTLDPHQVRRALEDSLHRLQTDYIDLYQVHWPDHGQPYQDLLGALQEEKRKGKIRIIGCSNETCWGVMKATWTADKYNLSRFESVQNNFSLINRRFQSELAQVCRQENISLLPYSPLGGGVLTGKYLHGQLPQGARFTEYLLHGQDRQKKMARRFLNDRTLAATEKIQEIANDIGMALETLSIAWTKQHDFVASTIIGVSHLDQLDVCLKAADVDLDSETLQRLDAVEDAIPNPMSEDGLRRL